jgi:protein deglycase
MTQSIFPLIFLVMFISAHAFLRFTVPRIHHGFRMANMSMSSHHPQVLVPVAHGSEEIETVTIVDTLVRAGCDITVASVEPQKELIMSRGVKLTADCFITECDSAWDAVILPGGMPGASSLKQSNPLKELLQTAKDKKNWVGAICAAPAVVLAEHGFITDTDSATCYPADAFKAKIKNYSEDDVVVDEENKIVTSRGPATAMAFSIKLIELLMSKEKADEIAAQMLLM